MVFFQNESVPFLYSCNGCNACVPLRVDLEKDKPSRTRRRRQSKFRERFSTRFIDATQVTNEHFILFSNYLMDRHPESGMNEMSRDLFLEEAFKFTHGYEVRDTENEDKLVTYAWIDIHGNQAHDGYQAYDRKIEGERSLGTRSFYAMMEDLKEKDIRYIYCGAWIKGNRKMGYKENLPGLETFRDGSWIEFDPELHTERTDVAEILDHLTDREIKINYE